VILDYRVRDILMINTNRVRDTKAICAGRCVCVSLRAFWFFCMDDMETQCCMYTYIHI